MDANQPSPLLQLPREIRDIIYGHVLERDVISIDCAVIDASTSHWKANSSPDFYRALKETFPLRHTQAHRRVWSVPALDVDLAFSENDSVIDPGTIHMTYQLADLQIETSGAVLNLHLLNVCKQVYSEASKVFYSKNTFSFTADYRIPAAFAFLCDRPAASLLLIRSLELAFTEDSNMRGTTHAHYPITRRSTDSLVLQYAYHYFTDLCQLISTPRMQLRQLHVTIDSLATRSSIPPSSVESGLEWEERQTNEPRPWIASWIQPLLKVDGLDLITLYWIFDRPRVRRMADTLSVMQQHMLANSRPGSRKSGFQMADVNIKFRMLHQDSGDGNTYIKHISPPHVPRWRLYCLDGTGSRTTEQKDVLPTYQETIARRPHVQDILARSEGAYICYYEADASTLPLIDHPNTA